MNINLEYNSEQGKDPVVELIYENIRLWEENIRLSFKNRRLREKVGEKENGNKASIIIRFK